MVNTLQRQRMDTNFYLLLCLNVLCLILLTSSLFVIAFSPPGRRNSKRTTRNFNIEKNLSPFRTARFSSSVEDNKQQEESTDVKEEDEEEDPDSPAGIGGAEFFGGSQKEEFYDPVAEREAGIEIEVKAASYDRFSDVMAFDTNEVASVARSLQRKINILLYGDDKKLKWVIQRNENNNTTTQSLPEIIFDPSLVWETPMTSNLDSLNNDGSKRSLIDELVSAKQFYEKIDLAIVSGKNISDNVLELSWELSVAWPTFWAPRVFLCGTSTCTLEKSSLLRLSNNEKDANTKTVISVIKQVDDVFGTTAGNNLSFVSMLGNQIMPRFWDWYHIGMTPSAEILPRRTISKKGGIAVYQLPPRLVTTPTIIETGTRENRHAEMIPHHAFTCALKTMGPNKQNYVPTTPVEVQIGKNINENDDLLRIKWSIPLSAQFQALNNNLPLPGDNPEDNEESYPTCDYVRQPVRQVATIKYGGNVQDTEIPNVRQRLYEKVLKNGWKPKLDQEGKPQFFFWQNDVKTCYVDEGFGMSVYDWRPKFVESNEIGIELVVDAVLNTI